MKDEINRLLVEPAYTAEYLRNRKDCKPEIVEALKEWGVINPIGGRGKKTILSPKGIKAAINISLSIEEEENKP